MTIYPARAQEIADHNQCFLHNQTTVGHTVTETEDRHFPTHQVREDETVMVTRSMLELAENTVIPKHVKHHAHLAMVNFLIDTPSSRTN